MQTDAQKRAKAKYNKTKMVQRAIAFSPNERDLLEHLDKQPNKMGYLKRLIREDMERNEA